MLPGEAVKQDLYYIGTRNELQVLPFLDTLDTSLPVHPFHIHALRHNGPHRTNCKSNPETVQLPPQRTQLQPYRQRDRRKIVHDRHNPRRDVLPTQPAHHAVGPGEDGIAHLEQGDREERPRRNLARQGIIGEDDGNLVTQYEEDCGVEETDREKDGHV